MEEPLRLEWRDPEELEDNPKNWRRHPRAQAAALQGVIAEVGWAGAALYNERTGRLIDGHLRKKIVKKGEELPVLIGSWDEAQEAKILVTLDPLATLAESDGERLKELLKSVQTDNAAVEELLRLTAGPQIWNELHPPIEPPTRIDQAGELQKKWNTKEGQLFQIGPHRLLCGDATNPDDVKRLMNRERAALFATDPPYSVGYTGGAHPQSWGNRGAANRNKDWSDQYLEAGHADVSNDEAAGLALYRGFVDMAVKHALTANAAWYFWHASRRQAMVERVWTEFGAFVHQQIIWVKSRPVLTYSTYLWQHEPCLFGWMRGEKPKSLRTQVGRMADQFPSTVWEVPSSEIETNAHPTSKPCKLFTLPMEMHTDPGEICYEPFSGSGSQLVAAEQTGRRCYAIEKSPPFVAVALERMAALGLKPELEE